MRSPNTSNTRSSHPTSSVSLPPLIQQVVAERAGNECCLFLDRDGVINRQVVGDYVRSWEDFDWLPRAALAITELAEWAPHIAVVTNQQGIGKGLMTADDVATIHKNIQSELGAYGVTVDSFLVCPHLASAVCNCRKPSPGLALEWLAKHLNVDPAMSVMAGDSPSDLEMARNVAAATGGCVGIHIGHGRHALDPASYESLWDFATAIEHVRGCS